MKRQEGINSQLPTPPPSRAHGSSALRRGLAVACRLNRSRQAEAGNSQETLGRSALGTLAVVRTLVRGLRRSTSGHGAMRPARGVSSKNAPEAHRPAEAPIRHRSTDRPSAQLIGRRPSDHPRPERPSSGHRRRCIFPRVRPRRRGSTCSGAVSPLTTYVGSRLLGVDVARSSAPSS